jgi:hypothetical protein
MLKFSKYLAIFCLGIVSHLVIEQPATFENGIFNIPHDSAIVDGEPVYFTDIQLLSDIEGNSFSHRRDALSPQ